MIENPPRQDSDSAAYAFSEAATCRTPLDQENASAAACEPVSSQVGITLAGGRRRLPNRRQHETFGFEHDGLRYRVGIGRYPDGQIGEVFLDAGKAGAAIQTYARDGAIALSLLLQHGCPIDLVRHAMTRNADSSAGGPLGSLLDHLAAQQDCDRPRDGGAP
jgi:hypothetical protein